MNVATKLTIAFASVGLVGSYQSPPHFVVEAQLERVSVSIDSFRADCRRLPGDLSELLSLRDSTRECWKGPYLSANALVDSWENQLSYHASGDGIFYSLRSIGVDHQLGTSDDIVFGDKEKKWRSLYHNGAGLPDGSVVRWKWIFALLIAGAVVIAVAAIAQRRKGSRKL